VFDRPTHFVLNRSTHFPDRPARCPSILLSNHTDELAKPADSLAASRDPMLESRSWLANPNALNTPGGEPADPGLTTRLEGFDTFSKA